MRQSGTPLDEYIAHLLAYADSYGPTEKLSVEQRVARDTYREVGEILRDLRADEEQEAGWSRGEHEAEARAVEAHQEAKHGDW